jgi:hypothetical protein
MTASIPLMNFLSIINIYIQISAPLLLFNLLFQKFRHLPAKVFSQSIYIIIMLFKSILIALAASQLVAGHGAIVKAVGDQGGEGQALGSTSFTFCLLLN